ncbi:hypothetical protein [Francisella sp. XLW-1]|uniref:hypothetical protein n=1 Tax=Francisella sp. XLW-1 TaxID=2610887 RepID=UPI00123DB4C5|nr:hypothetical protein [Francisella sp. XLW-1]
MNDITSLIRKIDQDRMIMAAYPGLEAIIPMKNMRQFNFLTQLDSVLSNQNSTQGTTLKEAVQGVQQQVYNSAQSQAEQIKKIKDVKQQDAPKKLLAKIDKLKEQLNNAKINFLTKKKISKLLSEKEKKYLVYAELVENAEQAANKVSDFSFDNIKVEQISSLKDKLKSIAYYECLMGDLDNSYSLMPELLNKKCLLGGDHYE